MKFALLISIVLSVLAGKATPAPAVSVADLVAARKGGALTPAASQLTCPIVGSAGPVNVRTYPETSSSIFTTVNPGDNVIYTCWSTGTVVDGNPFWDRTRNGHYISEVYIGGACPSPLPEC